MTTRTPSIAIATRLRSSLRRASAQGLAPLGSVPTTAGRRRDCGLTLASPTGRRAYWTHDFATSQ